jgi:hypothetical protein
VKPEKLEDEKVLVAIAIHLAIEGFDFVIGALHPPVVDT